MIEDKAESIEIKKNAFESIEKEVLLNENKSENKIIHVVLGLPAPSIIPVPVIAQFITKVVAPIVAPVVETPVLETPVMETPVMETPVMETPVIETPVIETPVKEEAVIETLITEAPVIETPVIETPVTEAPVIEIPVMEPPVIETPIIEAKEIEIPVICEPVKKSESVSDSDENDIQIIKNGQNYVIRGTHVVIDIHTCNVIGYLENDIFHKECTLYVKEMCLKYDLNFS